MMAGPIGADPTLFSARQADVHAVGLRTDNSGNIQSRGSIQSIPLFGVSILTPPESGVLDH